MLRRIINKARNKRSILVIRGERIISCKTRNTQIMDIISEKLNRIGAMLTFSTNSTSDPI